VITPEQASGAVARLAVLTHFPSEAIARAELARMLLRMVSTGEQLEWLVRAFVDHVGAWHGPREVRAVFCTRFKPADGVEEWSAIPGFTAADAESAYLERVEPVKRIEAESPRANDGLSRLQ